MKPEPKPLPTRKSIMRQISKGPTRFTDITGDSVRNQKKRMRRATRPILEKLMAEGRVKLVQIMGFPYYVPADWDRPPQEKLQDLEGRSRRDSNGCLLWPDYVDPIRGPMARVGLVPTSVRRTIWQIRLGDLGYDDIVRMKCRDPLCIEHTHMTLGGRATVQTGRKKSPEHAEAIKRGAQAKAKLNLELAREIRASKDSEAKEALKYGISKATIGLVRRNEIWKEDVGMFTGLIRSAA